MFLPVILIAATFFISASLGSEESCYLTEEQEDECASVCYPIVKPLLRYFEKCQGWEAQISQSQKDFSNLEKRHWEVQRNNDKLIAQIDKKNTEIELLKNQINDQKKTSELEILINQLREEIERIRRIEKSGEVPQANQNKTHTEERTKENKNSNNETDKVEVKTGEVSANQQDNSRNQTKSETQTKALPDSCSQNQKEEWVVQEIQIPGSDPLKVACLSHSKVGSGWMLVYGINDNTTMLNRTYEEYATGFGDRTDYRNNFFIGLENLHLLTNKEPYEMYLIDHYYKCDNFVIGNRTEGYLVKHVGECSGISFMSLHQGTTFSTFDRDEDGHPDRNLAKEFGYGWWFNYKLVPITYGYVYSLMMIRKKTKENKQRFQMAFG